MNDEEYIRQSVRRRVAIAVLHRLRRLAESEERQHAVNAMWARRVTALLIVVVLCAAIWFAVVWLQ